MVYGLGKDREVGRIHNHKVVRVMQEGGKGVEEGRTRLGVIVVCCGKLIY